MRYRCAAVCVVASQNIMAVNFAWQQRRVALLATLATVFCLYVLIELLGPVQWRAFQSTGDVGCAFFFRVSKEGYRPTKSGANASLYSSI
jgi:hypothetical protein